MSEESETSIRTDIVRLEEGQKHLKEILNQFKEELKLLTDSSHKRSEEMKDVFYVSDTTRSKLDTALDAIKEEIDSLKSYKEKTITEIEKRDKVIDTIRQDVNNLQDKKSNIYLKAIEIFIVIGSILIAVLTKQGLL